MAYTTRPTAAARAATIEQDAGLERLKYLEKQLAPVPVNSRTYRALSAAIRIEAVAYRKSLDADQAAARDRKMPNPGVSRGPLSRGNTPLAPTQRTRPAGSGGGKRR